jgi:hypothetical protein
LTLAVGKSPVVMTAAIELHDELVCRSIKIDDVWSDTMLSPKLRAG